MKIKLPFYSLKIGVLTYLTLIRLILFYRHYTTFIEVVADDNGISQQLKNTILVKSPTIFMVGILWNYVVYCAELTSSSGNIDVDYLLTDFIDQLIFSFLLENKSCLREESSVDDESFKTIEQIAFESLSKTSLKEQSSVNDESFKNNSLSIDDEKKLYKVKQCILAQGDWFTENKINFLKPLTLQKKVLMWFPSFVLVGLENILKVFFKLLV